MKRWIVRGFFIGVLLLCVVGWVGSFFPPTVLRYSWAYRDEPFYSQISWCVRVSEGRLWFYRENSEGGYRDGWRLDVCRRQGDSVFTADFQAELVPHFLGFACGRYEAVDQNDRYWIGGMPFWFITGMFGAVVWWVWRRTRGKGKGRAFPVEVGAGAVKR